MRRVGNTCLQRQKLEQVSEKEHVVVELPDVFEQRARQAQPLLEGLIKQRQPAQCYAPLRCAHGDPGECAGGGRERER